MMKIKRILKKILTLTLLSVILCTNLFAQGNQGLAVYRDGVFFDTNWHAGIMDMPHATDYLPVLHHPGGNGVVRWASWDSFMDVGKGNTFKGVYEPKWKYLTISDRDKVVAFGRKLRTENIVYDLLYQVYYDYTATGAYIEPDEIIGMRCDGVVEYLYEWYYFRVYGSDLNWDVTIRDVGTQRHHTLPLITPKTQVNYLRLVSSSVPN